MDLKCREQLILVHEQMWSIARKFESIQLNNEMLVIDIETSGDCSNFVALVAC